MQMYVSVTTAYVISIAVFALLGYLVVGGLLWMIRKGIGSRDTGHSFQPVDFWLGTTERAIAMALVIWKPEYIVTFIVAWMAAKIAANWGRMKSEDVRTGQLIALIGSAWSFGFAIVVAALLVATWGRPAPLP